MRTYLDCYPCFVRQALEAARMAGADQERQRVVLNRVLGALRKIDIASTPPEIGDLIHRIVREETGADDPYRAGKAGSTRQALALYPHLKGLVEDSVDHLDMAVRLAIAGNIIDLGLGTDYDLSESVERVVSQHFAIDDNLALREALGRAKWVLYLGDNAGETVFDRVLIETLDVPVTYVVKGGAILNDATLDDARAAGLDQVARLVPNGSDAPGTILERSSDGFRQLYEEAELIIAKGQANYETLSGEGDRIFFLLQTKCPVIAADIGAPVGSIVLKQGDGSGRASCDS
ncbi:MAG: ARMT1-like domain-containing protein [Anaerolineae bacterium]|nr:ARMT1-like domain-containing protein [Anaerolineae bacterium]